MAGLGGGITALSIAYRFTPTVISGQGFIALAAVIFGNWKPIGATLACLLRFRTGADSYSPRQCRMPPRILKMLPYVLTLLVLMVFVERSTPPRALGQPLL